MSNTALVSLNTVSGKWESNFGGRIIACSPNKDYVINMSTVGKRARKHNITNVRVLGESKTHEESSSVPELIEFDINERFRFLADYVDMVAQRDMKSAIVVGQGGLGKSHTVFRQLAKNGLTEALPKTESDEESEVDELMDQLIGDNSENEYVVIKGYSTPKGLFRTLYENRNRLVVFDDCDSILGNETSSNILKAALDSYDRRIVTWNSESFGSESDLPKSFEFKGSVIFISNLSMTKIPQAIISRSASADVSMTRAEIIERMKQIISEGEFMDDVDMDLKIEALNFISKHINNPQIKTINLRTLISVVTNRRCKFDNWERLSLSMMIAAR